jgi:hypothetical protein
VYRAGFDAVRNARRDSKARLTAELISGGVSGPELRARAEGHEKEIETAFVADENKTDLSK